MPALLREIRSFSSLIRTNPRSSVSEKRNPVQSRNHYSLMPASLYLLLDSHRAHNPLAGVLNMCPHGGFCPFHISLAHDFHDLAVLLD